VHPGCGHWNDGRWWLSSGAGGAGIESSLFLFLDKEVVGLMVHQSGIYFLVIFCLVQVYGTVLWHGVERERK